MTVSPAICPECGAMARVFEAEMGLYLGCDEIECLWMSEPERMEQFDPDADAE
ncbi:hypothetical protein QBL02_06290 [Leucobacter sp. UT-8R-CII-1-4]|uniref:hypothetical protein n=1 Tax=Leucobacter sp. UT-8R-CII-1-4 TaxID=3040075 RepID=UPI0024A7AAD1|nr:hypothetical protein [Leucobacter sp. UT-8R-CII-1-4]MDI6023151.1 hypothetical protein [Leucobacter sp. UT-8R-CII-1-4]